jgi:hypothetical protein
MARHGIVYRLCSDVDDEDYIGSTWDTPTQRLSNHKSHIQKLSREDKPIAKSLQHFNEIGWNNVRIELVEEKEFLDVDDRLFCEREWIEKLKPSLNTMMRPRITEEERKEWAKEYRQRPEVKARTQSYMEEYMRKYTEQNKDKLKEKKREYTKLNKDKIKEYRSTDEYKQRRNDNRRNTITHCDLCDVDIKGDSSAFDRHCLTKLHTSKLPAEQVVCAKQTTYYEMRHSRYKQDYEKHKHKYQETVECPCCKIEFQRGYLKKHNAKKRHNSNKVIYDFINS